MLIDVELSLIYLTKVRQEGFFKHFVDETQMFMAEFLCFNIFWDEILSSYV